LFIHYVAYAAAIAASIPLIHKTNLAVLAIQNIPSIKKKQVLHGIIDFFANRK
jgi:hypothetical protein